MQGDTTPQDQAVAALVEKFSPNYAEYRMAPKSPRDVSAMTTFTAGDGYLSMRPLDFGEIVDCLAEAGLLTDAQPPKACDEVALIERVAKALQAHNASLIDDPCTWDDSDQEFWLGNAHVAVAALREAT